MVLDLTKIHKALPPKKRKRIIYFEHMKQSHPNVCVRQRQNRIYIYKD